MCKFWMNQRKFKFCRENNFYNFRIYVKHIIDWRPFDFFDKLVIEPLQRFGTVRLGIAIYPECETCDNLDYSNDLPNTSTNPADLYNEIATGSAIPDSFMTTYGCSSYTDGDGDTTRLYFNIPSTACSGTTVTPSIISGYTLSQILTDYTGRFIVKFNNSGEHTTLNLFTESINGIDTYYYDDTQTVSYSGGNPPTGPQGYKIYDSQSSLTGGSNTSGLSSELEGGCQQYVTVYKESIVYGTYCVGNASTPYSGLTSANITAGTVCTSNKIAVGQVIRNVNSNPCGTCGTHSGYSEFRYGLFTIIPAAATLNWGDNFDAITEYARRKLVAKVFCGGIANYKFIDNWLTGSLYMFPFKAKVRWDDEATLDLNVRRTKYCPDLVYFKAGTGAIKGSFNWLGVKGEEFPSGEEKINVTITDAAASANGLAEASATTDGGKEGSMWSIFLLCLATGLLAVITPCVFPLIPVTVSFFLKRSKTRIEGLKNALWYSVSIVLIYTIPTLILTLIFGDKILYTISTHPVSNIFFFVVFIVFAISFFGAFELALPNSWANKADQKAGKGGLLGIFFMALTLVIVSFSCTGPIVGTVLVEAVHGDTLRPVVGMFGFSLAFALPFGLLALFPSWLNNLPKSGGWLNSVKVVLGFVELAFALKFLSIPDQTYHWGILDREIYLAIWIVIFSLLGLYLLGKIKFSHDSEVQYLSVPRLGFVIATFTFVAYMIPGMWGAPLKGLAGYLPPLSTQNFNSNINSHIINKLPSNSNLVVLNFTITY